MKRLGSFRGGNQASRQGQVAKSDERVTTFATKAVTTVTSSRGLFSRRRGPAACPKIPALCSVIQRIERSSNAVCCEPSALSGKVTDGAITSLVIRGSLKNQAANGGKQNNRSQE